MNWGKIWDYIPGVGLVTHTVREYKSRKGKNPGYNLKESKDRKALVSYIVQTGYIALAIGWKIYAGSYLGKGLSTGDWHPFKFDSKEKTEQIQKDTLKKKNLEKTIGYEELLK
jgi:hypothetical protein